MKRHYYAILAVIGVAIVSGFLYVGTSGQDHVPTNLLDDDTMHDESAGSLESGTDEQVPDGKGNDTKHYTINVGDSPQVGS